MTEVRNKASNQKIEPDGTGLIFALVQEMENIMTNRRLRALELLLRFSIVILLTFSVVLPALAAKRPSQDSFLWQNHYYGVLGKNSKISMILGSLREGQLVGSYRYAKIGAPIILSGTITPDGAFDLVEKTIIDRVSYPPLLCHLQLEVLTDL